MRVRQGDRLRIAVENGLAEETTVHWHGIRLPNAMDGVPHLTQHPIVPRNHSSTSSMCPMPALTGTTHTIRSAEQVGRGLSGALVVEEREPIRVDRDVVWVL